MGGGSFNSLGGRSGVQLGLININDTVAADCVVGPGSVGDLAYGTVNCLAVQPDGKMLVGGDFTTLAGQTRDYLGRFNADGTMDSTFNPGANGEVFCLALQPDGKILVGGSFTTLGGQTRYALGRLNDDGSVDTGFNAPMGYVSSFCQVSSLALQTNGAVLAGGIFSIHSGGLTMTNLARLNTNGTLDTSFKVTVSGNDPVDVLSATVNCLALQADGEILAGGSFTSVNKQACVNLGRLNPDGSLDGSFNAHATNGVDGVVYTLAIQTDGRILAGGGLYLPTSSASRTSSGSTRMARWTPPSIRRSAG